jgi:hypothetical protein
MASSNSFIIGLIGGILDFASASLLLLGQGSAGSVTGGPIPTYVWAAVLVVLGIVVVITSVLSVLSIEMRRDRVFSLLMVTYGAIMLVIGALLVSGYIVATDLSIIYSYGMVLVGGAMVANGVIASRNMVPI